MNLLGDGEYRRIAIAGYVEIDFLGSPTYGNELETNRNGLKPRHEFIPLNTDLQTVVGNNWARQWGLRVTKALGPNLLMAVAIENPVEPPEFGRPADCRSGQGSSVPVPRNG